MFHDPIHESPGALLPLHEMDDTDGVRTRKILIVSYHFHPSAAIGAVRWTGMASSLIALGHDVRVITAASQGSVAPVAQVIQALHVPHAEELLARTVTSLRTFLGRTRPTGMDADASKSPGLARRPQRARWRREASALLAAPDSQRNWVLPAFRRACEVSRRWQPDVVVTSGPPHSSHLVGRMLRQFLPVHWVADLRDPIFFVPDPASWIGRLSARFLERIVATSADQILTTSPTLTDSLRSQYPAAQITTILNGVIAEELPLRVKDLADSISISHVGSIYGTRDFAPVVRALRNALQDSPRTFPHEPVLNLAGFVSDEQRGAIVRSLTDPLQETSVRFFGQIPRDDALALVAKSTVSVVLAQDQHHSIPGKLYEAIAMGVPALVITEKGSATWHVSRALGAWVVRPSDGDALRKAITAIVRGEEGPPPEEPLERSQLAYSVKAQSFLNLLP